MSSFDWSVFLFSLGQIRQPIELFDCRYCQIFAMLENETSIPIPGHLFFTSLKINLLDRLTFETNNDNLICSASQYQKHVKNVGILPTQNTAANGEQSSAWGGRRRSPTSGDALPKLLRAARSPPNTQPHTLDQIAGSLTQTTNFGRREVEDKQCMDTKLQRNAPAARTACMLALS